MKNKVHQIDGKFYKECEVVMLSTEKASNIGVCIKDMSDIKIGTIEYFGSSMFMSLEYWQPQHLYITSNDEIKDGDWYVRLFDNLLFKACSQSDHNVYESKKIIATTNTTLKIDSLLDIHSIPTQFIEEGKQLPRPSNEFIQSYIKANGKGFDKVLVEVINSLYKEYVDDQDAYGYDVNNYKIKLAPDNTITIKPVTTDTWEDLLRIVFAPDISQGTKTDMIMERYNCPTRKINN